MVQTLTLIAFCLSLFSIHLFALPQPDPSQENLMDDLLIVDYWNQRINERYPVTFNHLLQGGYFSMPSARMGEDGEIGVGYSYVPPYRNYNLRCQILGQVEISGNYRVFHGVEDPVLSRFGFGDFSDKGANFKFALFRPEDSQYQLPGIAFGIEDFIGTRAFHAQYVVITQVILAHNLELSLGWGMYRIRGFFGGFNWMPFRKCGWPYLNTLSICAEYDATPYRDKDIEKHPKGRIKKFPINFGLKYRLWDYFDFSLSYIRGDALAFSVSTFYNLGTTQGFIPKIDDPLPYTSPVNLEPLGIRRQEQELAAELVFAFEEQSLSLMGVYLFYDECGQKTLRLKVLNETYRLECELREQLNQLLASLIPEDIDKVIVIVEAEAFPIQEYQFQMNLVRLFACKEIGPHELAILTPLQEVSDFDPCTFTTLFSRNHGLYNFELSPDTHTFFGSSSGKFKYSLGLYAAFNGYLWDNVYYNVLIGWTFISNMGKKSKGVDILNPSQLINVRSDIGLYYRQRGLTLDQAYLQKNWNLGRSWYARLAAGYFEEEYGGAAAEALYYPINSCWAFGIEAAVLKKRSYRGLGFTNKIRKYHGFILTHKKFLGSQFFANIYYDWEEACLEFKIAAGKFLANDWGVRNEISRYFPSGLRLTIWYTLTNGGDRINGKTYHDKGVSFSMPFDIFYTYSERSRWNYGMSAWLRDVGVQAMTGLQLYELINDQRQ